MPLYEYRCLKCGKTFEILQTISAEPLKSCIHCQGRVKKLISAPAFQFKGSGWYITDYKNKTGNETKPETVEKKETKNAEM